MHIVSVKCNVRSRREILSAEVRFIMKRLIREYDSEERTIDPGAVLGATLSWMHDYTWLVRRLAGLGITPQALQDCMQGVPVRPEQSDRAMRAMFELLDNMALDKGFVGTDDVVLACLASNSEALDIFVSEGLNRLDDKGQKMTLMSVLRALSAPRWVIDACLRNGIAFERRWQMLEASLS